MFATAQDLFNAYQAGKFWPAINSIAAAEKYLERTLQTALNNEQDNKRDRPWAIVDFAKRLDPNEAWIGFEFETGFDDKQQYQQFIRWLWEQPYVAIDREGTGVYPVEVAFPPQTVSDIEKNGHLLQKAIEFYTVNNLTPARNPTTFTRRDVGIHAGISTKKWRAGCDDRGAVAWRLNKLLDKLNAAQRKKAYGRAALHWGCVHNRDSYVELKMFRAIPTAAHVDMCLLVTKQCIKMLDALIDDIEVFATWDGTDVFNFITNPDAVVEVA